MWNENSNNRWTTEKDGKFYRGKWTHSEQLRFQVALDLYGRDWKRIQKVVKTRKLKQVHSFAQKHFLRLEKALASLKKTNWYPGDPQEDSSQEFKIYCWYSVDF